MGGGKFVGTKNLIEILKKNSVDSLWVVLKQIIKLGFISKELK